MEGVNPKKKARIEKEAVHIPADVTVEILKTLPVKSLLRFSCASKTWYSLISDPEFCKRACVLICRRANTFSTVPIQSFLMNGKTPIRSTPLSLPWQHDCTYNSTFLGSCNGLVCVDYRSPDREFLGSGRSSLILCNPSTRKFRKLPSTRLIRNWFDENTYAGFGYDESTGDYKFVWMVCRPHRTLRKIVFDVFSLKSNTWSRYARYPSSDMILSGMSRFGQKLTGVFCNGAIHWVIRYSDGSSDSFRIIAYNLASGEYKLLDTPQEREDPINSYVVSLSGCLCLCIHYIFEGGRIDLWMMKEYGAWLKLISIPTSNGLLAFYPILFSKEEGEIVGMVKHLNWRRSEVCKITRFQVEQGAVVKSETLLCEDVSTDVFDDYAILHMEESFVSIN